MPEIDFSSDSRARIAARLFGVLTLAAVAFQIALAAGAPWGRFTMGGMYPNQLPPEMRVAAAAQAFLLLLFAIIVATRARLILSRWYRASRKLIWIVVAYTFIGVVLNAITPSPSERAVWLPVVVILGICALMVARSQDVNAV